MKVCDVVYNSIWYDPRVKKQIVSYKNSKLDVVGIGIKDERFKIEEIKKLPCECDLVEIYKRKNKIVRLLLTILRMKKAIINNSPDIIHANDILGLIPSYLAKKVNRKAVLVYDSHEICSQNYYPKRKMTSKLIKIIEKHILKRVDIFICVSNSSMNYFKNTYDIKSSMVITNCIDKNRIMIRETNGIRDLKNVKIINQGGIVKHRGYDTMLCSALIDKNKDHKYIVRGTGSLRSFLEKEKQDKEIINFILEEPVNVTEVVSHAANCDIGVAITEPINLNYINSVSNKLFEYAAAGIPVIMSDIPEHRLLNEEYHFGLIMDNNSPEELVKKVNLLCSSPSLYKECCIGANKMSNEINWDDQFDKLINLEMRKVKTR